MQPLTQQEVLDKINNSESFFTTKSFKGSEIGDLDFSTLPEYTTNHYMFESNEKNIIDRFFKPLEFKAAKFLIDVDFSGATFTGKANFSGVKFIGKLDLSEERRTVFYCSPDSIGHSSSSIIRQFRIANHL